MIEKQEKRGREVGRRGGVSGTRRHLGRAQLARNTPRTANTQTLQRKKLTNPEPQAATTQRTISYTPQTNNMHEAPVLLEAASYEPFVRLSCTTSSTERSVIAISDSDPNGCSYTVSRIRYILFASFPAFFFSLSLS